MEIILKILKENWWLAVSVAVGAYLIGSVNFAIIVTRLFHKGDIRDYGSGNAGATNVLRSTGKMPALLTALGDLGKSFLAVYLGGWLIGNLFVAGSVGQHEGVLVGQYLAGVCCILGHIYPLYFGFRGGKGVITTLGLTLMLDWRVGLLGLAVFIVIFLFSRMVSLGSVIAGGIVMPILTYVFRRYVSKLADETVLFCTLMAVFIGLLIVVKHIPNIRRIFKGTESRIGRKG